MKKINLVCISLVTIISLFFDIAFSEWGKSRESTEFSRVPQEQNEKAIVNCLEKLRGFTSTQETTSLDSLKTKIERIYGMKQSTIQFRELYYKTQSGEKWRVEFYLSSDSQKGKEKYRLKFYKSKDGIGYAEAFLPDKEEVMEIDKMLKFGHSEEIESDERWERFGSPLEPLVSFKSKNFKVFEVSTSMKKPKKELICSIAGGHPFCQCTEER